MLLPIVGISALFLSAFFPARLPEQQLSTTREKGALSDIYTFAEPIDAVSVGVQEDTIQLGVSAWIKGRWTAWEYLEIEKEFDPLLRESNLITFPVPVSALRFSGATKDFTVHPIRVSKEPISYEVAATTYRGHPRILSRRQWGADETLLYSGKETSRSDEPAAMSDTTTPTDTTQRVQDCEEAQEQYPDEFRTERTVTENEQGKTLRWPRRYSPEISLLVVHHTAQQVTGDTRPPVERVRALYEYHADSRGWGDIGYHYLIDEEGQIYEGRSGGPAVVGGHAYCANVGTMGIALMGNFELEKPTQVQMQSLKWLLTTLADQYSISLSSNVTYHGISFPTVVGHKDIVSTQCPGYYVRETIGQLRKHLAMGTIDEPMIFPRLLRGPYANRTSERRAERLGQAEESAPSAASPVYVPTGPTMLTGRPGGQLYLTLNYMPPSSVQRGARIAEVRRSSSRIGIWQQVDRQPEQRVRSELVAAAHIRAGNTVTLHIRVQLPDLAETYTIDIGDITYELIAEGRRMREPTTAPVRQTFSPEDRQNIQTPGARRPLLPAEPRRSLSPSSTIRIRLTNDQSTAAIAIQRSSMVNDINVAAGSMRLGRVGNDCVASQGGTEIARGIVRIGSKDSVFTLENRTSLYNQFRGMLECRIVSSTLVLINELPLEEYMRGLAEEPDGEPWEKQRAFAVAARSYAAHYLQLENRKFPGMPYDGDDSPARFQAYGGIAFEKKNPLWVRAVDDTAGNILVKDGDIIKAAYFSSDDGRTRTPAENGWGTYPHAEVFTSKSDPWCAGMPLRGHGVGMSGCGAKGQAQDGKTAEEILEYYYPDTTIDNLVSH